MSPRVQIVIVSVCIAAATLAADSALAADRHWNVGSGLWTQGADWSPNGVPQTADNAIVDFFNPSSGGGVAQLATSNVSAINSGTVTSDGVLSMVGNLGAGSLLVNNGLVVGSSNMSGTLNVLAANPLQIYTGGMTVVGPIKLGVDSGAGTINQNAGTVNVNEYIGGGRSVSGSVVLGDSHASGSMFNGSGVYNLSGGLLSAQTVGIGGADRTTGTFNLSGSGVTNLSGFGDAADGMEVGFYGIGVMNQSGGTNRTFGLAVGFQPNYPGSPPAGTDVYTLSGGSLSVSVTSPSGGPDLIGITSIQSNGLFNYKGGQAYLGSLRFWGGGRLIVGADDLTCQTLDFSLSPTGVLDLKDHSMLVYDNLPDQRDALKAALASGYSGGAWTGPGINSSVANFYSTDVHRTAVGMAPTSGGAYQLKYTYYGDANLDGTVDTLDFNSLASNFGGTGKFWYQADFNYDGVVDTLDFNSLAANFGQSLPPAAAAAAHTAATVPEPGIVSALMALGSAPVVRRRRQRRQAAVPIGLSQPAAHTRIESYSD